MNYLFKRLVAHPKKCMGILAGVALVIFCSSFFYRSNEKVWVIDDHVILDNNIHFAIPFVQDIRSVSAVQDIECLVVATTRDNVRVRGKVRVDLRLIPDEDAIFRVVGIKKHESQIKMQFAAVIKNSFEGTIARHELYDLQNILVLEAECGKRIFEYSFPSFGLKWAGTLKITDLEVCFGDEKQVL